jgi:hypothetical protein
MRASYARVRTVLHRQPCPLPLVLTPPSQRTLIPPSLMGDGGVWPRRLTETFEPCPPPPRAVQTSKGQAASKLRRTARGLAGSEAFGYIQQASAWGKGEGGTEQRGRRGEGGMGGGGCIRHVGILDSHGVFLNSNEPFTLFQPQLSTFVHESHPFPFLPACAHAGGAGRRRRPFGTTHLNTPTFLTPSCI